LFDIQDDKFFTFISQTAKDSEEILKKENDNKIYDLLIKTNFIIDGKKKIIKKIILESKSSTNNIQKTIDQFKNHIAHLTNSEDESQQTLFLLFIQNHPTAKNMNTFKELFESPKVQINFESPSFLSLVLLLGHIISTLNEESIIILMLSLSCSATLKFISDF